MKQVFILASPIFLGVVFSHISGLIDNLFASQLPNGHLSYLSYAKKLIDAILLIGPVALVTVYYSHATHLLSQQTPTVLRQVTRSLIYLILFISIPLTCIIIGLRHSLVAVLFQGGLFSQDSTQGTSLALWVYAAGLVTFSLEVILVHTFFALSDTKTPIRLGIICVIIDIFLAASMRHTYGYVGIAAALVLSKTLKVVWLGLILNHRLTSIFDRTLVIFLTKLAMASALLWVVLWFLRENLSASSRLGTLLICLVVPSIVASSAYLFACSLLGVNEVKTLASLLIKRWSPHKTPLHPKVQIPKCGGASDVA